MKKGFLAGVVAAVLSGCLMTVSGVQVAQAATVSNEADLRSALAAGDANITLGADIALTSGIELNGYTGVISGNGHTISAASPLANMFHITGGSVSFRNVTVDGAAQARQFWVGQQAKIKVTEGSTLKNGHSANDPAHGEGGSIYAVGGTVEILNSTIAGSRANLNASAPSTSSPHGGAVYAYNSTVTLDTATISDNMVASGTGHGGAFYVEGTQAKLNVLGTAFTNNCLHTKAIITGGAIYVGPGATVTTGKNAAGAKTTFSIAGYFNTGGAIRLLSAKATLADTDFVVAASNRDGFGTSGAAIATEGSELTITRSNFSYENASNNTAKLDFAGGFITAVGELKKFDISDSNFTGRGKDNGKSTATYGGAICFESLNNNDRYTFGDAVIKNCKFSNFTADNWGGAIALSTKPGEKNAVNLLFQDSTITQATTLFWGNQFGGGIAVGPGNTLTMRGSIIEYARAARGGGIYNQGKVIIDRSAKGSSWIHSCVGYRLGGAIYNDGELTLADVNLQYNTVGDSWSDHKHYETAVGSREYAGENVYANKDVVITPDANFRDDKDVRILDGQSKIILTGALSRKIPVSISEKTKPSEQMYRKVGYLVAVGQDYQPSKADATLVHYMSFPETNAQKVAAFNDNTGVGEWDAVLDPENNTVVIGQRVKMTYHSNANGVDDINEAHLEVNNTEVVTHTTPGVIYRAGAPVDIAEPTAVRDGYSFVGWYNRAVTDADVAADPNRDRAGLLTSSDSEVTSIIDPYEYDLYAGYRLVSSPVTISGATGIKVQKVLEGRNFAAGDSFEFVLSAKSDGAPMPPTGGEKITVSNGETMSFGAITYDTAGVYKYEVRETAGNLAGITYDSAVKEVTVTVTDNGSGALQAVVSYDPASASAATFTNTYAPSPVTVSGAQGIQVKKNFTGRAWTSTDSFTFTVEPQDEAPAFSESSVTVTNASPANFGSATFTKAGTYTYLIKETQGNIVGVTYDTNTITATVSVTDNGQGALSASVSYSTNASMAEFNNTYSAGEVTLSGETAIKAKKTLTGRAFAAGDSFEFVLAPVSDNAPMPAAGGEKITVSNAEPKGFGAITYTKAGSYTYKVTETAGDLGGITYDTNAKEVTVTVTDAGDGTLTATVSGIAEFENTYKAAPVTLSGNTLIRVQKTLSGRDWKDTDSFTFTVTPQNGAPALENASVTVTNGEVASFGATTFDKAGTYTYTIAETPGTITGVTYDTNTVTATVTVTDNGQGQLVAATTYSTGAAVAGFTNTYAAGPITISGNTAIKVKKNLTGRAFVPGDTFEFVLSAKGSAPLPQGEANKVTVTNGEATSFGAITYTKAGIYTYEVRESAGSLGGITYDSSVKEVTVTVTDDGSGVLSASVSGTAEFTNTYEAAPVTLSGDTLIRVQKTLSGRDWKDTDSFTFTVTPQNGAPALENASVTVTNGEVASFGAATFSTPGTYTYTIAESAGTIPGVTYDQSSITATVTVTDNGAGQLVATTTYSTGAAVAGFTNTYAAGPITISGNTAIKVKKTLTGRDFVASDAFEFVLTAKDGAPLPAAGGEKLTATNGEATSFGAITYTKAGTYVYEVRESAGSLGGITYDESVKEITVTVTDEGDGALRAEVSGTAEFENTYKAEPVTLVADSSLCVRKTLEGREWRDDDAFEFVVEPLDGAPAPEMTRISATSTEAISFGEITFSEPGEYLYRISEVAGTEAGMTYDTMVVTARVEVIDDTEGQLHATVTYSNGTATAEFINTYVAPEVPGTPTKPAAPRKKLPAVGDTTGVTALITGAAGLVAATLGRVAKRRQ